MSKVITFTNHQIEITEEQDKVVYRFSGNIDQHFKQKDVPRIKKPLIIFELEGINNVNSNGIQSWIHMVNDFSNIGKLVFRRCSINMIDQINIVPACLGKGEIESFFAPYYCNCGEEVSRLIEVKQHKKYLTTKVAPPLTCEKCKKALKFDALEETFFSFLDK